VESARAGTAATLAREGRINLHDVVVEYPRPGRYDLVLVANGEDLAHHALEVTAGPPPGEAG
jgi:hypothetical protein